MGSQPGLGALPKEDRAGLVGGISPKLREVREEEKPKYCELEKRVNHHRPVRLLLAVLHERVSPKSASKESGMPSILTACRCVPLEA